jgi:hypothetical protein
MSTTLTYKGYGRIYVLNQDDVRKVRKILNDRDNWEYENYYPPSLITTLDKYPQTVYVGKFDLWPGLEEECKKAGIPIFILDLGNETSDSGTLITSLFSKADIQAVIEARIK